MKFIFKNIKGICNIIFGEDDYRKCLSDSIVWLIFTISVILIVRYQIQLLNCFEFCDESETIVTAKMIAAGSRLYSEIFTQHGPLTFLPGLILEKFGNFGVIGHRIPIAILQLTALSAIYFSPLLKNKIVSNIYTILAAFLMLFYLSYGHMYLYQTLAGLLLIIILAQYAFPAIICPEKLTAARVIIGNLLISSLPFLAIIYLPIAGILFFVSTKKEFFRESIFWLTIGVVLNFLFLIYIGSIPGYLALHFYLNLTSLKFCDNHILLFTKMLAYLTGNFSGFIIFTVIVISIIRLSFYERSFPWRSILILIGISSLTMRDGEFHGLPYFYSSLVFPLIFFVNVKKVDYRAVLMILFLVIIGLLKIALIFPADQNRLKLSKIPSDTEFARLTRIFTSKSDKIIAYPFANFYYLTADRLPASGYFFYLPFQKRYDENPKFGIKFDVCQEINHYRPKIIFNDKANIYKQQPWESYGGCVQEIMDRYYYKIPDRPYYIRRDLVSADSVILLAKGSYEIKPSVKLAADLPIKLFMTSSHRNESLGLKRIGIMFGTYGMQNEGDAELVLRSPYGNKFQQRFSLPALVDNRYHYFNLDAKRYTSGEIRSITGKDISTWEIHSKKTGIKTCVIYEYSNGKIRFTPGCPL